MSIRKDKEKLIKEIQKLRASVSNISYATFTVDGLEETVTLLGKEEVQKQINKIHDIVFNM